MGGREVGGLANQLAAHMNFEDAGRSTGCGSGAPNIATRPGMKAVELFEAVAEGRISDLIAATNPAVSMPRAGDVRAALVACPFVVVSDCWPTDTTALADVVLPAAAGRKNGAVTNSEPHLATTRVSRAARSGPAGLVACSRRWRGAWAGRSPFDYGNRRGRLS